MARTPTSSGSRIGSLCSGLMGQRMGLFAGSGVGKSMLLGMMTRFTDADVTVVGLIGERGREVLEFVREVLGEVGLQKSVVIAAPADSPPLLRVHGAMLATSVAEYFRAQGKQVLLLMDSITRFAQAQREIGLAVGEPPTTKGYPPSTFARISELLERAGTDSGSGGSITAFYTVLAEGDDHSEVIADTTRAILDGHIVLSRKLADSGQYPAINVESSISRAMHHVVGASQISQSQQFRALCAIYEQQRDLINVGAYQAGTDPVVDRAIEYYPRIQAFLRQPATESVCMEESRAQLAALFPQTGSQEQGAQ